MAQVTVRKVVEGQSHLVLRIDLLSDGTGELTNYVIMSPSDLIPAIPNNVPAFRLMQAWYGFKGFSLALKVGTITPTMLWTLVPDADSHVDFRSFGGLVDPNVYGTPPPVDDGKLTVSTKGFSVLGLSATMVLELRKTNQATL